MTIFRRDNTPYGKEASDMVAAVMERPAVQAIPKPIPAPATDVMEAAALAEYREVADTIGLSPSDLLIEEFKVFLTKNDIPSFSASEVVKYMDALTARDNPSKLGWHWCPVRAKDAAFEAKFGRPSVDDYSGTGLPGAWPGLAAQQGFSQEAFRQQAMQQMMNQLQNQLQNQGFGISGTPVRTPSSDYYDSRTAAPYARTIPLHALKKIALVEREFGKDKVAFLVTDYTTQPHVIINPDPFLMVMIPNPALAQGKGRFIIDVWDEPGFGIAQMVG